MRELQKLVNKVNALDAEVDASYAAWHYKIGTAVRMGPGYFPLWVGGIVFVAIGSLSVAGPVAYWFLGGAKAAASLDELRDWLTANNAAVMMVLLLVLGALLVAQGLGPLTAG